MRHPLDRLYQGLPIFVLSTGTSLRGFDFSRLDNRITVGINRVIEYYAPTVVHLLDRSAHTTHAAALARYDGIIIANEGAAPARASSRAYEIRHNVDTFRLTGGRTELSTHVGRSFNDGFYGGGAGCTALHTAVLLGGDPIYLLGYDFYEDNGRHFDEWDPSRNASELYDIPFDCLQRLAREPWMPRIYNCNPSSRLRCFPFLDLDTVAPPSRAA
ncbi:MAG TPA: hypothetical protein VEK57_24910 [Thermoanaerobaculia bacterium]|nr:hypothetical protein [Thermoanaerobaculia bacterium]